MKRESIIAILLGVFLGIGVGSVVLSQTNKDVKQAIETTTSELKENVKPNRTQEKNVSFSISSPSEGATVSKNSVTITGKGTKDSLLVILSSSGTKIVKLAKDEFSTDLALALGENSIDVTYYPAGGGSDYIEKELSVYYLPE